MKFIYCKGGNKPAPRIAKAGGADYGIRGDYTPYERSLMIDYDFHSEPTEQKWLKFLAVVREHRPDMALIPDYFAHVEKVVMLRQIEDVRKAGARRVAVCPKFNGAVAHIPKECIVAVSIPTTYAGFMPLYGELIGRELHLLGGHPDQQAFCIFRRYAGLNIISADGNIAGYKAERGQFWDAAKNGWITTAKKSRDNFELAVTSVINTQTTLQTAPTRYISKRVQRAAQLSMF